VTLEVCTETVREQDPDRFGAVLLADPKHRAALITLYALNLEIARAPFQSNEPMLAEMRLQWWVDRLAEMGRGIAPPLHDVLTPLWEVWGEAAGEFADLAEARRRDCAREPFESREAVVAYVDDTAGRLMWLAAQRLGATPGMRHVVADHALGAGLGAWLRALPQLQPMQLGLADGQAESARKLAEIGREAFRRAAYKRRSLPKNLSAALFRGTQVNRLLKLVAEGSLNPLHETVEVTPFQRRAALARVALTGRWWA
jgi:phytoene synthase